MMKTITITIKNIKQLFLSSLFVSGLILSTDAFSVNYIEDAREYFAKGEYKAAIIQLKNQLKQTPKDADARFLLGRSYLKVGNIKQANKEISRASELEPANEEIALSYAGLLLLQKKYNKVDKVLSIEFKNKKNKNQRQVLKAYVLLGQNKVADAKQGFSDLAAQAENSDAYTGLAKVALLENNQKEARQWIEKSLIIDPANSSALKTKARIEIAGKNYKEALIIYSELIKQTNNMALHLQRAAVYMQLNDLSAAKNDIQKVLEQVKNHPQANYLLSRIQLQEKNYKKAQASAQKVINVMPRNQGAMLVLGVTHFAQKSYHQADKYLTQYLASNPDDMKVQNILASVYLAQKNPQQVIVVIEGIDKDKREQNAQLLTTLGTAYLLKGEHEKGIALLSRAKVLSPENQLIQQKLIGGQLKSGDVQGAIAELEGLVDSKQKTDSKVNYLLIASYIQQKEYNKAEKKINELIQDEPKVAAFYNMRAVVEKVKGNVQQSEAAYEYALSIDNNYIPAYIGLAESATQKNDFKKAEAYYLKVLEIEPKNVKAYIYLAAIAMKQANNLEAEKQLKTGMLKTQGDIKAQVVIANYLSKLYVKQKTPEKILPVAQQLIKKYPDEEPALSFLAAAQLANNQNKQAAETLNEIIKKDTTDVKHRLLMVSLLVQRKDENSEVYSLLNTVIELAPEYPKPLAVKSAYLLRNKHFKQALDVADYTLKQFPELALGEILKGDIYRSQNDIDKALSSYRKAYQLQANNKLLFIISDVMISQGKITEAVNFLEGELKGSNEDVIILVKIANIYQINKNNQQAINFYEKILTIDPDNMSAINNLAWIYAEEKNPKALILAEKAYKLAPDSASIIDTYAYAHLKTGDINEAINLFKQAEALAPKNGDIKYHLAEAYFISGETVKAKELLNTILKSKVKFSEKENALLLFNKISQ